MFFKENIRPFCLLILLASPFISSGQLRSNSVALGYGTHRYFDWKIGSPGFELQITRKIGEVFRVAFDLSYVVQDLTVNPDIDLADYENKIVERRLTYFDLGGGIRFMKIEPIDMQAIVYAGPSFELGNEFLLYGIINGPFSELNGSSLIRHEIGLFATLEFVFVLKKRLDIRPRFEIRNYTTGSPCYSGFLMIGYEFDRP
jgi:hypothetical protein